MGVDAVDLNKYRRTTFRLDLLISQGDIVNIYMFYSII